MLGVPELKDDARFKERDTRKANRKLLTPLLEAKLTEKETLIWAEALNKKGIPSGEILSLEDALNAPQIVHRETIKTVDAPEIGELKLFNLTAKFEKTPGDIDSPPPRLSEHTNDLLREIGYNCDEIKEFKEQGII